MPNTTIPLSQGVCTSRDKSELQQGEMQDCTGYYYKPGDPGQLHTSPGRSLFDGIGDGELIKGVALCKFDSGGTDRLIAYSGTKLWSATPGDTGDFASLVTGLSADGTHLSSVHYNDRWYIATGADDITILESDGSTRAIMQPIPQPAVVTVQTGAVSPTVSRPTTTSADSFGWAVLPLAYDTSLDTFASATVNNSDQNAVAAFLGFASDTASDRKLYVTWSLDHTGQCNFAIAYNVGAGYVNVVDYVNYNGPNIGVTTSSVTITENSSTVTVRIFPAGGFSHGTFATVKVYDIRIASEGYGLGYDLASGVYYAYTEYDEDHNVESPYVLLNDGPGGPTPVTGTDVVTITHTFPAVTNANATHWRVYRTHDGGVAPRDARLIAQNIPISQTTFIDDWTVPPTDVGTKSLDLLKIQVDADADPLYFPASGPPPTLAHLNLYGAFIVGLSDTLPRGMFYNLPGFPESWPEIYKVEAFPVAENDRLVTTATVGDTLVVGAQEAIFAIDALPEATGGLFQSATVRALRGQPGCVGRYAMTSYSVAGEPRAAWVSRYGIHITNGQTASRISDDLDWTEMVSAADLSTAVLFWDRKNSILILAYDAAGIGWNTRTFLIHMGPEHQKQNGMPKITRGYGRISSLTAGEVDGIYKIYSGDGAFAFVYLENADTALDASQSYSGTAIPRIITPPRIYGPDGRWLEVVRANVRHSDWGTETATLAWSTFGDDDATETSVSETVTLNGYGGSPAWIAQSGQAHELTLTHTGTGRGSILDIQMEVRATGKAGRVIS